MAIDLTPSARLDEFDQDEWRDVALSVRPDWTDEDFEDAWAGFVALKASRELH